MVQWLINLAQNPWPHPPAEQTASWLSFAFYFFVGDTIRAAAHVKHLSLDMLPPIADFDDAENLMKHSLRVCRAIALNETSLTQGYALGTRSPTNEVSAASCLRIVENLAYVAFHFLHVAPSESSQCRLAVAADDLSAGRWCTPPLFLQVVCALTSLTDSAQVCRSSQHPLPLGVSITPSERSNRPLTNVIATSNPEAEQPLCALGSGSSRSYAVLS